MAERAARIAAFLAAAGWGDAEQRPLPGDASFRRYVRLVKGGQSRMLMDAPPPMEDVRPFVTVATLLQGMGLSAPTIHAEEPTGGLLLIEDFGDDTYAKLLAEGAPWPPLYELGTDMLIALLQRFTPALGGSLPRYDASVLGSEPDLLTQWYLPGVTGRPADPAVVDSFRAVWHQLMPLVASLPQTLVMRDYFVDNLMRLPGRAGVAQCGLLDFQDALVGPAIYDLVSLLQDARRDVPADIVAAMRARYRAALAIDEAAFDAAYAFLAAQRTCRIIGVFTRLCHRDGKPHYLKHIPRLWAQLDGNVAHPALALLADWLARHVPPALRRSPPERP